MRYARKKTQNFVNPILFRTFAVVLLWMAGDESLARQKSMAWPIIIKKDVLYVFF